MDGSHLTLERGQVAGPLHLGGSKSDWVVQTPFLQ